MVHQPRASTNELRLYVQESNGQGQYLPRGCACANPTTGMLLINDSLVIDSRLVQDKSSTSITVIIINVGLVVDGWPLNKYSSILRNNAVDSLREPIWRSHLSTANRQVTSWPIRLPIHRSPELPLGVWSLCQVSTMYPPSFAAGYGQNQLGVSALVAWSIPMLACCFKPEFGTTPYLFRLGSHSFGASHSFWPRAIDTTWDS